MIAPATRSAAADPAAPLAARFAQALRRVWPQGMGPGAGSDRCRLGLAVSGGPDSLALLLLARAALPGRIAVASVDHGLRPAAAAECAGVAQLCAGWNVPHATLRVTVAPGNLQAGARAARYAALAGWMEQRGLAALATAHHADDQAETLLMRLNRGCGLAGLAGIRARGTVPGTALPLLRPLLAFRRAELEALVRHHGLAPARDPSNADPRFERVRIRTALASGGLVDPLELAAAAGHLAEAEEALDWAARREWAERVSVAEDAIRYRPQAPRAVMLRIVERAVGTLGPGAPRGRGAARLLDLLLAGRGGTLGGVVARVEGEGWVFRLEPPRRATGG